MSPRPSVASALEPDQLRRLGFFREFASSELRRLARVGTSRDYSDGELLATEGTRKQRRILYVVLAGELHYVKRIRVHRANVILVLRPGDVGGFLTFFNDEPSPVSVLSVGRTRVFEVGRREFQELLAEHPLLAAKVLVAVLRATVTRLDALMRQAVATYGWALELEQHLRNLPLVPETPGARSPAP